MSLVQTHSKDLEPKHIMIICLWSIIHDYPRFAPSKFGHRLWWKLHWNIGPSGWIIGTKGYLRSHAGHALGGTWLPPSGPVQSACHVLAFIWTYIYIYIYVKLYVYIYIIMCVCLYAFEEIQISSTWLVVVSNDARAVSLTMPLHLMSG